MLRTVFLIVLVILAGCWLVRSAIDALANRVVDRIEERVAQRRQQRRLP